MGLTGSGSATEGSDYSNLSNITITAGDTTGTTSFTPISDTNYETSSGGTPESATIDISSVSGGSATENGTQQVTISITEKALNSGTQLEYSSSNAETRRTATEFTNFNYYAGINHGYFWGTFSNQNPLEVINAHKAHGYGLTGAGKEVAIVDNNFNMSHGDLNGKTTSSFGVLDTTGDVDKFGTGTYDWDFHGNSVAGIIAADAGDGGLVGVAPGVSLHLTSHDNYTADGYTYHTQKLTLATASASSAVAQNNSWGYDVQLDTFNAQKSSTGLNNNQLASYYYNGSYGSTAATSFGEYITALDNFQSHGVVVVALSNDTDLTEADISAALPELYPQLADAWISAVNIEIDGTSGNEVYSLQSAPCGSTAKYCLGADGYGVSVLTGSSYRLPYIAPGNGYVYHTGGTSFVAPMISGAIAILAEAFPNQSPEIWADRLLASADNDWFTHNGGAVTFGNGVQHGYSTLYGHGILDIYAALQPITSNAYTASIRVANSEGRIVTVPVIVSSIRSSSSFGDAIKNALKDKTGYFYDGLDGGFKYDLSSHALLKETDNRPFKLEQEFSLQ